MNLVKNIPRAERDIRIKINQIVNELLKYELIREAELILLGGGFGRGEGSVRLKDNIYETTNDFDIIVIYSKNVLIKDIKDIADKINNDLNLKFFSIDVYFGL